MQSGSLAGSFLIWMSGSILNAEMVLGIFWKPFGEIWKFLESFERDSKTFL